MLSAPNHSEHQTMLFSYNVQMTPILFHKEGFLSSLKELLYLLLG